jgi:hypothetical protein
MVTGLFSEGSGAKGCPGSGCLPVSRVWATNPNAAWRSKQPSLWPPIAPTPHQTLPRAPPDTHRRLPVAPLIADQRGDGESPVSIRWGYGDERAAGDATTSNRGAYAWLRRRRPRINTPAKNQRVGARGFGRMGSLNSRPTADRSSSPSKGSSRTQSAPASSSRGS